MPSYTAQHLAETAEIVQKLDPETLENMVNLLADVRNRVAVCFSWVLAAVQRTRPTP